MAQKQPSVEADALSAKVISLCERRGFITQNSSIYGGMAGFFDFLNYGSQLKRNVENEWWHNFVESREDVVGIDGSIIAHPKVWQASGHTEAFNDPLVECPKCKEKYRADHLVEQELKIAVDGLSLDKLGELIRQHNLACPRCKGTLELMRPFNLMFTTTVGPKASEESKAYLRPETAQLIFADFKQVLQCSRKTLPFGIAQIGRAFRNEISPRNFVFRCREFSQMELEYFMHPDKLNEVPFKQDYLDDEALFYTEEQQLAKQPAKKMSFRAAIAAKIVKTRMHAYWLCEYLRWLKGMGVKEGKLRLRQHVSTELSHYSSETWDVEYEYPWGFKELLGIANRTDFDLKQHAAHSGEDLSVFIEESRTKVVPYVIEPSIGVERLIFTLLLDAFEEKQGGEGSTIVLHLLPKVAPIKAGIFPLVKKGGLNEKAHEIFEDLRKHFACEFDSAGSIGKRYARMDEVGTPYCVTVDFDTLKDGTVTVRDRDSCAQIRVHENMLASVLTALIAGEPFEKAGKPVKA